MATITKKSIKQQTMYHTLDDIEEFITWGHISRMYFGKSASWLYHKMSGKDGNGKPTEFDYQERLQLKGALCDLADRIRRAADNIEV